jgi:hypothetical protein
MGGIKWTRGRGGRDLHRMRGVEHAVGEYDAEWVQSLWISPCYNAEHKRLNCPNI